MSLKEYLSKLIKAPEHLVRHVYMYAALVGLALVISAALFDRPAAQTNLPPIQHVVIIFQENHSFDNVLGKLCVQTARCNGATTGKLSNGQTIPLSRASDLIPIVGHAVADQQTAIDGGAMDKFDLIRGCGQITASSNLTPYACYSQYDASQIPNLASLAQTYTISDTTYEFSTTPTWAGHMVLASATMDNFEGDNPYQKQHTPNGWGCDSMRDTQWWDGSNYIIVPSCVPDASGKGPYRASPVAYVPTIFDRLEPAGKSWKIYGGTGGPGGADSGYALTICPTFYECLGSSQRQNFVPAANIIADAAAGQLPNFSIVTPTSSNSQHNSHSMAVGDNWIGQVVSAVQNDTTDWASTAIFITYDDCGCFYDHVTPPSITTLGTNPPATSLGIRVPMVIVSPYANLGGTDSNTASFISMLAFTEHLFGLSPLNSNDAAAYDYSGAFSLKSSLGKAKKLKPAQTPIPAAEQLYIQTHPGDPDDPT